jgi:hypothetical protein
VKWRQQHNFLAHMTDNSISLMLAKQHLEAGIETLEAAARERRVNIFSLKQLGSVAAVLCQKAIADRAARLLRMLPDEEFWKGLISNFALPEKVPESMRSIPIGKDLEVEYPTYRSETVIEEIRAFSISEKHIACCLEGRFEEARLEANSGFKLEMVGSTLAVLGEFVAALEVANAVNLEPFRQQGIRFVIVLEKFRRGCFVEANSMLAESNRRELGPDARAQIALAICGRVPWIGYPYPDW